MGKSVPGRGNSRCKGPEARTCPRNSKEVVYLGPSEGGGERERDEAREGMRGPDCARPYEAGRGFGVLSETRAMEGSDQRGRCELIGIFKEDLDTEIATRTQDQRQEEKYSPHTHKCGCGVRKPYLGPHVTASKESCTCQRPGDAGERHLPALQGRM